MSFEGLAPVTDMRAGAWIAPRLCGFGGRVCCVVPTGFASYARVLHPAAAADGGVVSWAQVCELTGRVAHPLMQWQAISTVPRTGAQDAGPGWPGGQPAVGNTPPAVLASVLDVLVGHTPDPGDCYHAMWDGWGWLAGDGATAVACLSSGPRRSGPAPPPPAPPGPGLAAQDLTSQVLAGPRLSHPHRDYLLFRGPLRAALSIGHQVTADWRLPRSPNLLWPGDKSWLLAAEIDFDSTLAGGSTELVDELLRAPGLEAWPVGIDDDLTVNGDHVNQ